MNTVDISNRKYTPVECVLNIYEPRKWFYISGWNGYEISNDGYLRSMKHFRKYPFGILIKPVEVGSDGAIFVLSNDQNERIRININDLFKLAKESSTIVSGYPRDTIVSDVSSRNKYAFLTKAKPKNNLDEIHHTNFVQKE